MFKVIFALCLLVSASFALSITRVEDGTTAGALPKPFLESQYYDVDYYLVDIPMNARQISFTFENLNPSGCSYLNFYMSNTLPCNPNNLQGSTSDYVCDEAYNPNSGVGSTPETVVFGPEGLSPLEWRMGGSVYIGVTRYNTYNATCAYRMNISSDICPNANDISVGLSGIGNICYPSNNAVANFPFPVNNVPSNGTFFGLINVPANTVALTGVVNSTSDALNLYGRNYASPDPTSSSKYICSTTSGTDLGDGNYSYVLNCVLPRSGLFVFMLFHDEVQTTVLYNITMLLTMTTCNDTNGGVDCAFQATEFNATTDTGSVPHVLAEDAWRYWYYDFPVNGTGSWTVTASGNTTGYLYIRQNGYPDINVYENSNQYASFSASSNATKHITAEDVYPGGRWVVGINNRDTAAGTFYLTSEFSSSTGPTNTVAPTQPTTTPETTAEDSSAYSLIPSAIVTLFALFYTFF